MASENKPWDRMEGEGIKPFQAFTLYLQMGSDRTIRAVVQKLDKSLTLLGRWSSAYDWPARAAAYDEDLARRAREENERFWLLAAAKERRDKYDIGQTWRGKLAEMSLFPTVDKSQETVVDTYDDGRAKTVKITILKSSKWAMKDVPGIIKATSDLIDKAIAPDRGDAQFGPGGPASTGDQPRGPMFVEVEEVRREDQPTIEPPKSEEA